MSTQKPWRERIDAGVLLLYVVAAVVIGILCYARSTWPPSFRDLPSVIQEAPSDYFYRPWELAADRFGQFEGHLVTLGTLQLGVLAVLAGMLFKEEIKLERKGLLFWVIMAVLGITALAYLHCAKVMMAYASYLVHLERFVPTSPTQVMTEAWRYALQANALPLVGMASGGLTTLVMVLVYPTVPLLAAIWGFGTHLGRPRRTLHRLTVAAIAVPVLFVWPDVVGFLQVLKGAGVT